MQLVTSEFVIQYRVAPGILLGPGFGFLNAARWTAELPNDGDAAYDSTSSRDTKHAVRTLQWSSDGGVVVLCWARGL